MNYTGEIQSARELGVTVKKYLLANAFHVQQKERNLSHPCPPAQIMGMRLVRGEAKAKPKCY